MTNMKDAIEQFNKAFKEEEARNEGPKIPKLVIEEDGAPAEDRGEFASDSMDRGQFASSNEGSVASNEIVLKPKKNRISAQDRINQQTRKYNEAMSAYNFAMAELERTKKERDQYAYQAKQKHEIALINHEHALKTDKEYSKKLYKEAYESGDADQMANAQELLAERTAQLATLKIQKSMQPEVDEREEEYAPQYQPQYHQEQYEPEIEVAPEIDDFLERNPWLDQNSKSYKPQLAAEFMKIGHELEDRYLLEGREDILQSSEFFDHALAELKARKSPNNKPMFTNNPAQRNPNMVAPVNRSSGEQHFRGQSHDQSSEMKLSPMELRMAMSMPDETIPGFDKCRTLEERRDLKAYHYWKNKQSSDIANQPL